MKSFLAANKTIIYFNILLIFFSAIFFSLSHSQFSYDVIAINYPALIAKITDFFLKMFGLKTSIKGFQIRVNDFSFNINYHCTSIFVMQIFLSAVLASRSSLKEKLIGIVLGVPVLEIINIIRLVILGIVGSYNVALFNFFHEYLWQGIYIFIVIVLWLAWYSFVVKHTEKQLNSIL